MFVFDRSDLGNHYMCSITVPCDRIEKLSQVFIGLPYNFAPSHTLSLTLPLTARMMTNEYSIYGCHSCMLILSMPRPEIDYAECVGDPLSNRF